MSVTSIESLEGISKELRSVNTLIERCEILKENAPYQKYLNVVKELESLPLEEKSVLYALVVIGEGKLLDLMLAQNSQTESFYKTLKQVDRFYKEIGGIAGYHLEVLKRLKPEEKRQELVNLHEPEGVLIDSNHDLVSKGILALPQMAEIYPIGGAGDRLNLQDEATGEPLPAACLNFCGRSLLEGMVRDLQGREHLYYQLTGVKTVTPIVLMTSLEKDNDRLIKKILKDNDWFGRGEESFYLFSQPLVPVLSQEGRWCFSSPMELITKPGGHGVIWKCARDSGALDWLKKQGRTKCLVRQINNPIAGEDSTLLGFAGAGIDSGKGFGFASCRRKMDTAEGMVVFKQHQTDGQYKHTLENIEYSEFAKWGLEDVPKEPGGDFSAYPSNTNILFVDLKQLEEKVEQHPFPGMMINMKTEAEFIDADGKTRVEIAGRLESMMQSISEDFGFTQAKPIEDQSKLNAFITFSPRKKTISVTKKSYSGSGSIEETPEGGFYDLIKNHHELLKDQCGFVTPSVNSEADFLKNGPNCLFLYHPALGPDYSVIAQKIRNGIIHPFSEMQIEASDVDIEGLDLKGSLLIESRSLLGKCTLRNVRVTNRGIDREHTEAYWNLSMTRHESLRIIIQGNGEFFAEGVVFDGDHQILVPDGHRVIASQSGDRVQLDFEEISKPSWRWDYSFTCNQRIVLRKSKNF